MHWLHAYISYFLVGISVWLLGRRMLHWSNMEPSCTTGYEVNREVSLKMDGTV